MRPSIFKLSFLFIFLTLLTLPSRAVALELALPGTAKAAPEGTTPAKLTYPQLRGYLEDFADRYMQMVGQAADMLQKENRDPDFRAAILSTKLFPCSAAFSIAIDANPHMGLLNMLVLVHLQGSVWKEEIPKRFPGKAAYLLDVEEDLEKDIDSIALKTLTPEQLGQLKTLILEWRTEHPHQRYVSYIRFSDFSELNPRRRDKGTNLLSISGLLSALQVVNMDEATRSVDQARMVAERTIYLSQRLPTLLRWHTEMLFYGLAKDMGRQVRAIIWEWAAACAVIMVVAFLLALLYRSLSRRM